MGKTAGGQGEITGWSLAASSLVHLVFAACLIFLPVFPRLSEPHEESISVEIMPPPPDGPAASRREPAADPVMSDEKAPPVEKHTSKPEEVQPSAGRPGDAPARMKPSRMLSQDLLADPRSHQARMDLAGLAPADRAEQLCNLEAMAQIGQWNSNLRPDSVVAYAMAETKFEGDTFLAEGAAVHSRRDWYRLLFKCDLSSDHARVAAFEFRVGDLIPKEDRAEHGLPDANGSHD